ncbi:hypothetical protein V9T40_003449 [Parthenolecanium corni]|uniref:Uncharacterized protein n=1 Tax=Parthenolecanium corni TaxID=536013 RepID=A0AAN9TQQ4_9HEMI
MYFLCVYAFLLSLSTFSYAEVMPTSRFISKLSPSQFSDAAGYGNKFIDTTIVIDTQSLMRAYPNASKNPEAPTPILHKYGHIITSKENVNSSQGTADMYFHSVVVGDILRWYGVSESANLFNQVIPYNMKHTSKSLSPPSILLFEQTVLQPNSSSILDLHPVKTNFIGLQTTVLQTGNVKKMANLSTVMSVAEEFEKLEVEVETILSTEPKGEVLGVETMDTTTSDPPLAEPALTDAQKSDPKKSILIPPRKDDPNRTFKRKKVVINNPPPPQPPTSFEDRQAQRRNALHNFYRRRRFSQDLRMFRGLGETFLHLLEVGKTAVVVKESDMLEMSK